MSNVKQQLAAITARTMKNAKEVFIASGIRVGNMMITGSPVDKGIFINSWNTTIDGIDYSFRQSANESGADSINDLTVTFSGANIGDTITVNNPQPYGLRLEYDGWSEKAPNGFVRINTAKWESIVQEEVLKRR